MMEEFASVSRACLIGFYGGLGFWLLQVLVIRLRERGFFWRSSSPLSLDSLIDANLAKDVAAKAAHALLYYDDIGGDELSEFERYERSLQCEKRIERAVIAYVDTIRKRYEQNPSTAKQESGCS